MPEQDHPAASESQDRQAGLRHRENRWNVLRWIGVFLLGAFAGIGVLAANWYRMEASERRTRHAETQIEVLGDLVVAFSNHYGRTPLTLDELVHPPGPPGTMPYTDFISLDPWGNPYRYTRSPEPSGPFDVETLGADGRRGGDGEAADIHLSLRPHAVRR